MVAMNEKHVKTAAAIKANQWHVVSYLQSRFVKCAQINSKTFSLSPKNSKQSQSNNEFYIDILKRYKSGKFQLNSFRLMATGSYAAKMLKNYYLG